MKKLGIMFSSKSNNRNLLQFSEQRKIGRMKREKYWLEVKHRLTGLQEIMELSSHHGAKLVLDHNHIWLDLDYIAKGKKLRMLLDPTDVRSAPFSIIADGKYEDFQAQTMFELIKESHNFLDIGSNMGFYSLSAAIINPEIKIYAFEPNPKISNVLETNIAANSIQSPNLYFHTWPWR
jgi:hypothetical protein